MNTSLHCININNFSGSVEDLEVYCFSSISNTIKKPHRIYSKVYEVDIETYIDNYFCVTLKRQTFSNTVLAYKQNNNDFSLKLRISNSSCTYDICQSFNKFSSTGITKALEDWFGDYAVAVRIVSTQENIGNETLELTAHITTKSTSNPYVDYLTGLKKLHKIPHDIEVIFFRSSQYCLPETIMLLGRNLTWNAAEVGFSAPSNEICIRENGEPVFRSCIGSFISGVQWSTINGNCADTITLTNKTKYFHTLLVSEFSTKSYENVIELTNDPTDLTILDIYYLGGVIITMNSTQLLYAVKIFSNLLSANSNILERSQELFNSTDNILNSLENILEDIKEISLKKTNSLLIVQEKNIFVMATKPFVNKISGVLIFENNTLDNAEIRELYVGDNIKKEVQKNFEIGIHISESGLKQISQTLSVKAKSNITLSFCVISNKNIFNSKNPQRTVVSDIVGVSITGSGGFPFIPITVVFYSPFQAVELECAFWDYGRNTERKKGNWSVTGINTTRNGTFVECTFSRSSHFVALVTINRKRNDHLNIVLTFTRIVALLGLSSIFVSTVLFEHWRKKPGTKILVQLALVLFLEIIVDLTDTYLFDNSYVVCRVVQIIWHYVFLCKMCWMLIFTRLNYHRFVKVVGPLPNRLVLTTALFGWGLPVVPIAAIYITDFGEECFLQKDVFFLAAYVPYMIVLLVNATAFCFIIFKVLTWKVKSHSTRHKSHKVKLSLFVLLFFMLDIPCIFLIFGENTENWKDWLSFNVRYPNATLQGFVLFIFYVLLNKEVKHHWNCLLLKLRKV